MLQAVKSPSASPSASASEIIKMDGKSSPKPDEKGTDYVLLHGSLMERYSVDEFALSNPGCAQAFSSFIGQCMVESRGRIKIKPGETLTVSARFRALGPKPSQFYFGLKEFTDVGGQDHHIESDMVNRQGKPCRVVSYDSKAYELELDEVPMGWTETTAATLDQSAEIGFYFDGEVKNPIILPTLFKLGTKPAYTIDGKKLNLRAPLPEGIANRITRDTRVMNHLATACYNYAGANAEILDPVDGWVNRQFTIRAAPSSSPNWSGNNWQFFKPLVTSVSLLVLANWGQKRDCELAIADLTAHKYKY